MGKLSDEFSDELTEGYQQGRFETTQGLDTREAPHASTLISLAFLVGIAAFFISRSIYGMGIFASILIVFASWSGSFLLLFLLMGLTAGGRSRVKRSKN
jgi:hypothetical protein